MGEPVLLTYLHEPDQGELGAYSARGGYEGLRRALRRSVAQLPGVIPDRSLVVVVQSASSVPSVVDGSFMATLQ